MPPDNQFQQREEYYCTLFHELIHATGHESRLDRASLKQFKQFGDHDYSQEELVAELGAAMLCGAAGLAPLTIKNSAAYIQSWLKALKNDRTFVIRASGQAQKACDYVRGVPVLPPAPPAKPPPPNPVLASHRNPTPDELEQRISAEALDVDDLNGGLAEQHRADCGMTSGICDAESARQLNELCRRGRLYEVEAWVRQGKPVNVPPTERKSPLLIAVEKGFHSLVELLLQNGAAPHANGNALETAVKRGDSGIAQPLIDNGADPNSVRAELVCMCGNLDVVRLFLDRGVDLTRGNGFAIGLVETKKALLGIYRSYRDKIPALQTQADIALCYCCKEGRIGGVYRLLWAGANPRARVPELYECRR